ncbi:gram-negative porin family protein [Paraburkholderia xenovorans LB400]|uniref:Outer membrane porin, OmpC family n=1 Tax=Paraburkholderia xenovorans (strain LB400) TaxID=266265 RepID=Q13GZ3_PARXL|nr:porin [Paraburkholderia xenovorans]ABE36646.1 outer membrane porin, OmpC family [Paraburkholderia xenovorans LB400]AIP34078.1 gram-negative porin family protein [Paraburkholderia xenovorans LB400]
MKSTFNRDQLAITIAISGIALVPWCSTAHADENFVQMYGIVDAAVGYVSDVSGHSSVREIPGTVADRFGLRGQEALGGNSYAIFTLENGFNVNDGTIGQGSSGTTRIFGRQAFVGLQFPALTVTAGRQYDMMYDMFSYSAASYLSPYWYRPGTAANLVGANGSSADFDRLGGVRVDNSVKVSTSAIPGWTFSSMVGLGGQPGTLSDGSTVSAGVRYQGKALGVGAAYTNFKEADGTSNYVTWAVGSNYVIRSLTLTALYTSTQYSRTSDSVKVFEAGVKYQFTPAVYVGAAYAFMLPNHDASNVILRGNHNQAGIDIDYSFSKRTDVYAMAIYQRASGGNAAQIFILPSTGIGGGSTQTLVAVGIRTRF